MYFSDYDPHGNPQRPAEAAEYAAKGRPPGKRPMGAAKIVALCLSCALIGGLAGGAGTAHNATTITIQDSAAV